jgi:Ser/Thr protein kinase RdoA (MazF antagonist)
LRIGHTLRTSESFVRGEVEWINYLVDHGVGAAAAVASAQGEWVERIDDGLGGAFLATAFVRAYGESPWRVNQDEPFFEAYGRLIGRMHAATRQYRPRDPLGERPFWKHPRITDAEHNLPLAEEKARARYRELVARQEALPTPDDAFGLIHFDAHMGNFLVGEDGRLTLFDFDDCNYNWFANDIAMVIFYLITNHDDPASLLERALPPFLRGYAAENRLNPAWLEAIPLFLKVRELELYAVAFRSFGDPEQVTDGWLGKFLHGRRARIEDDVPYVDFDFTRYANFLVG